MDYLAGILIVILIAYFFVRPSKSRTKGNTRTRTVTVKQHPATHWEGKGHFEFEIVGESFYQMQLSKLAGDHPTTGASVQHIAELIPEDDNEHDPKAVAVRINGLAVGYMSREDARSFRRRLGQKGLAGMTTTCNAIISGGGTRKNGEKLHYGVRLDIKNFE